MYTIEEIKKHKYFKDADYNFVLDSLTGVISRQYILDYAKYLIKNQIPFAMAMVDLDNFKFINDNYGHHIGDLCLKYTAEGIQNMVSDRGLVGRFGGDEFIIIYLENSEYNSLHDFYDSLYYDDGPLRTVLNIESNKISVTGTVGSASFPKDSNNYDDLFMKMDKALYRGKSKGRNCYIIYVHEKHKDIVIKEREGKSLLEKFEIISNITKGKDFEQIRSDLIDYLYRILHPYNIVYLNNDNYIQAGNTTTYYLYDEYDCYNILDKLLGKSNVLAISDIDEFMNEYPITKDFIEKNRILSFVVTRVGKHGFIFIFENNVSRMWQDSDLVLMFYSASELSHLIDKR
jgi:diguanylate cyclase (GGDEF)-like protein